MKVIIDFKNQKVVLNGSGVVFNVREEPVLLDIINFTGDSNDIVITGFHFIDFPNGSGINELVKIS